MINVNYSAPRTLRLTRRFWLLNLLLILLYLWTLRETTTLRITIQPSTCTAHTPERSLAIPCADIDPHATALYRAPNNASIPGAGLLDWLAPGSQWGDVRVLQEGAVVEADLRRAQGSAGLVLLESPGSPGQQSGWAFVVTALDRRGVWWRWEEGCLTEPIRGIPFQKPALAQFQSLLRRALNAHHAALLLLALAWLLKRGWQLLLTKQRARTPSARLPSGPWRTPLLSIPLLLLTFAVTLHIAVDILERIPHVQDSVTYLFQARLLAGGHLSAPPPPMPAAFEQEFLLVHNGRWFGKYPPGFPALLAVGVWAGAPWVINPLLATLSLALVYALVRRAFPTSRALSLLAAGMLLVSPFFLFMSGSHMAHNAELFWILLFMLYWVRAQRQNAPLRTALLAGTALGALFLTRQLSAVAAGLPFIALTLLRPAPAPPREVVRARLVRLACTALAATPFLLLLLAHQWALTGDLRTDPRLLFWDYDTLGFGYDIGEGQNAFTLSPTPEGVAQTWYTDSSQPPRGHNPARGIYNVQQNWLALEQDLFGWLPAFTFAFIWLFFLLRRPRWLDWALLASFLTLLGAYVFYWADGISYGPRYFFVALPALILLSARGVQALGAWLGGPAGKAAVLTLLLALVGWALLISAPRYVQQYEGYNFVSRDALTRIERQTGKPALVFVPHSADWWHYGELFSANTPWLDGPIVVARDRGPRLNRQLLAHFPDRRAYRLLDDELQPLSMRQPLIPP